MRLTQKKIEEILVKILGEEGLPLIRELIGKENISEFDLAKKINQDIKLIRKRLYLLYNHNIVGFTRKKDKEKGWYIYYWTLLPESIRFSYYKMKKELLTRLRSDLEEELEELFFVCPNKCVRLNFDKSMEYEFHCPECGELINQDENQGRKEQLQKHISELEEELTKLEEKRKLRRKAVKKQKKEVEVKQKEKRKVAKKTTKKAKSKKETKVKKKVIKKTVESVKKSKVNKEIKLKKKQIKTKQKEKRKTAKKTSISKKKIAKKIIKKVKNKKTTKRKPKKDEYF